ncbi:MAG: hypothetical protein ACKVXR_15635 [Planctomycetota bacterium]
MLWIARLSAGIAIVLFAFGCSTPSKAQTPEEERYLFVVDATPLEFTVPITELDGAVDRAVEWLVKYGGLEASESDRAAFKDMVRTTHAGIIGGPMQYRVADLGSQGYMVAFALAGEIVSVKVTHEHEGGFGLGKAVARNARILAHYIRTRELIPHLVET